MHPISPHEVNFFILVESTKWGHSTLLIALLSYLQSNSLKDDEQDDNEEECIYEEFEAIFGITPKVRDHCH